MNKFILQNCTALVAKFIPKSNYTFEISMHDIHI